MTHSTPLVAQGTNFVFTLNNPDGPLVFPPGVQYVYQLEKGENGTPHYQGYCRFPKRMRLAGLKKILPTAHWENRKGTHEEAYAYCTKEDTRISSPVIAMECSLHAGKRSDLSEAREVIMEHGNYRDCINDPRLDEVRAKYPGFIKETLAAHVVPMEDFVPRRWQQELLDIVTLPCDDDRRIWWYYDEVGKAGKTKLSKYLASNHGALVLRNNKTADAAAIYDGQSIVCCDYTRTVSDRVNYEVIEMLKDGILMSGKYVPVQKVFNSPHVVCFANFLPNPTAFSADRVKVVNLGELREAGVKRKHDTIAIEPIFTAMPVAKKRLTLINNAAREYEPPTPIALRMGFPPKCDGIINLL